MILFPGEDIEHALKRFRKEVEDDGDLRVYMEHLYFISPSAKRHKRYQDKKHRLSIARRFPKILRKDK